MKKLFTTIILLSTLFTGTLTHAAAKNFPDVDSSKHGWAMDSIDFMVQKGVIEGDEFGRFKPDSPVTKAEFIAMIYKLFDKYRPNHGQPFEIVDVPRNGWEYKYISEIVSSSWSWKIYYTKKGPSFNPRGKLTRMGIANLLGNIYNTRKISDQEAYKVISRMKDIPVKLATNDDEAEKYRDDDRYNEQIDRTNMVFPLVFMKSPDGIYSSDDDTQVKASLLASLVLDGIMTPNNGKFEPNKPLSRAEAVTILHRLYNHMKNKGELKELSSR